MKRKKDLAKCVQAELDWREQLKCVRRVFYDESLFAREHEKRAGADRRKKWLGWLLNGLMAAAGVALIGYFAPMVGGRLFAMLTQSVTLVADDEGEEVEVALDVPDLKRESSKVKPIYDLSLPEGKWIRAGTVGIEAPLESNASITDKSAVKKILDRGLYLYPDYSEIGWRGKTVIVAGHHYNFALGKEASKKSFQNLKDLQVGDLVQVIDDYKIWTYEVYKVEEAREISDREADLILYTCVWWWDSKLRLLVYAKIIE